MARRWRIRYKLIFGFGLVLGIMALLLLATLRGLCVAVGYDPKGHHDVATAMRMLPELIEWLGAQLRRN